MLSESNNKTFFKLIKESSIEEIIWMCGYMSGLLSSNTKKSYNKLNKEEKITEKKITLVYGTETGNAKNLAFDIYQKAKNKKLQMKLISLDQYRLQDLEKEDYLFVIISTHGEGEPPSSARSFFDFIHKNQNLSINKLKYSVLALGDKSYSYFCKAGVDVDKRLHNIGAIRIIPLHKCDVDYEEESDKWFFEILNFFQKKKYEQNTKDRRKKVCGKVLNNILLSDKKRGSNKEIYHIEISVQNEIKYLPGDSIGIFPENPSNETYNIIEYLSKDRKNEEYEKNIFNIIKKELNIFHLSDNFLRKYSFLSEKKNIPYNQKWKLIDLLKEFPIKKEFSLRDLIKIMDPIKPRFYSISSSPKAHHNEIHITVSRHRFQLNGETVYGHCSDFLSKLKEGEKFSFFIHRNQLFRLPKNPEIDIILIGPGTGIAPFRSFLYEREAMEATGRNWLFFGDQHFYADFLYQTEIQNWKRKGIINRVNLSFSRDQGKRIYVQDKIWENRTEFFSWIKNGAYIYVCGKKTPMSIDVEKMIFRVIEKEGGKDPEYFIKEMKKDGRYLKDVY